MTRDMPCVDGSFVAKGNDVFARLIWHGPVSGPYRPVFAAQKPLALKSSPRVSTTQTIRAALLAIATVARPVGLRLSTSLTQGSALSGFRMAAPTRDVIPMTKSFRRYWSPIVAIRQRRSLPPLDVLSGVNPIQAAESRALRNAAASATVARIADAVIGPMPGIASSRFKRASSRAAERICRSSAWTRRLREL